MDMHAFTNASLFSLTLAREMLEKRLSYAEVEASFLTLIFGQGRSKLGKLKLCFTNDPFQGRIIRNI